MNKEFHIKCGKGDIAKIVLLPGAPERSRLISEYFDESREVARNREFWTFTGRVDGIPISVTSTGIGCPSTAIAVEELIRCGAKVLIRVGTSGSLQDFVAIGDLVIATSAVRDEGTSRQYVPVEYPAVADIDVVFALKRAAQKLGYRHHLGIVHTKDSFYSELPDTSPIYEDVKKRWNTWINANVLATEMESSTLFIISSIRGVKAGTILAVVGSIIK